MDSCASNLVFSIPMRSICSCSRAHCNYAGTIILLPLITIPSITTMSSQEEQHGYISSFTLVLNELLHLLHTWTVHLSDHLPGLHA